MTNFKRISFLPLILFTLFLPFTFSCVDNGADDDPKNKVTLYSPTVDSGGELAQYATAKFEVEFEGSVENQSVIYEWALLNSRGIFVLNNIANGVQVSTISPFLSVRGDIAGDETLRVRVLDEESGNILGEDNLSFEIIPSTTSDGCFNESLLFYRNNNWESPGMAAIGFGTDTRKVYYPDPQNWLFDITTDGKWFVRLDYSKAPIHSIWVDACDGSESKKLVEGSLIFSPVFGTNDEFVYFTKAVPYPEQIQDPRAREIMRVNIETGVEEFVTDFKVFSGEPLMSPDGQYIAFKHSRETFNANGTYAGSITHLAIMPSLGGPAQLLFEIESNDLGGFDWSPDSKDLIFNWHKQSGSSESHTNGIYRINASGGNAYLIFPEPQGTGRPIYYANGTRIAFQGHPAGNDTQYDIWSIDANGGDLQRLTDEQYNVFLSFIWEIDLD